MEKEVKFEDSNLKKKATMLQQHISFLKKSLDEEKQRLNKERAASSEELGSAHLPTCPMSDLADISPQCVVHGHLTETWRSFHDLTVKDEAGTKMSRSPYTMMRQNGQAPMCYTGGGDEGEWMAFSHDYSTESLQQVNDDSLTEVKKLDPLPSPPPETLVTNSQSYMTRLLEVDDMCKEEMTRVNGFVPNLDRLNQLVSDWDIEAANSPDFNRMRTQETSSSSGTENDDSSSIGDVGPDSLRRATSQLDSIEEFVSGLQM